MISLAPLRSGDFQLTLSGDSQACAVCSPFQGDFECDRDVGAPG